MKFPSLWEYISLEFYFEFVVSREQAMFDAQCLMLGGHTHCETEREEGLENGCFVVPLGRVQRQMLR